MNAWDRVLSHLQSSLNPQTFSTWFKGTALESDTEKQIVVRAPNPISQKWLETEGRQAVAAALENLGLKGRAIRFVCSAKTGGDGLPAAVRVERSDKAPTRQPRLDFEAIDNILNPRYTFDSFVVGSSNQFAHAAAQAVAAQPARQYNPLFLYGGVGLGKTHLMQAVGHTVRQRDKNLRIAYLSAEKFTNEVIHSLRFEKMVSFRDKYRSVDVLLLDDIQFLAGKERTQEEFFHTFNTLYDAQKQIVISSDAPPKEIPALEERLRSRFEMGLIADIQPPDLETKIAILMRKADTEAIPLPPDVAEYIARGIRSNIRELEGALIRLLAYSSLIGESLSLPLAERVLKNVLAQQDKRVSIEAVQRRVSDHFGLSVAQLKSKTNARSIAYPRQVAMFLATSLTGASLPELGRAFGGKHHTTVLHSVKKIAGIKQSDKDLARLLHKLTDELS